MATSNALSQVAQMYNLLESILRSADANNRPLTITELNNFPAVLALRKSQWQVRDLVTKTLLKRGHVTEITNQQGDKVYAWDKTSEPFNLAIKQTRKASTKPSAATITKPEPAPNAIIQQMGKIAQEVEIAMGGFSVVIGRNPLTGRVRITIDEV